MSKSDNKESKNTHVSWKRIIQNNVFSFKYLWHYSKPYLFLSVINIFVSGFSAPVTLLLTSRIYNMLDTGYSFPSVLTAILLMFTCATLPAFWNILYANCLTPKYIQSLHLKTQTDMFEKARRMELSRYDNPTFYNDFILTMQYSDSYAMTAVGNITSLISSAFTFAAIFGILAYIDIWMLAVIFVSTLIGMPISTKLKKIQYDIGVIFTPNIKKKQYIDRVYKLADYSKELRITHLNENLQREYEENSKEYVDLAKHFGWKKVWLQTADSINSEAICVGIIGIALYKLAVLGTVTLGGFTVVINANLKFRNALTELIGLFVNMPQQSLFIDKVRAFMEYEPEGRSGTLLAPPLSDINLRDVTFSYNNGSPVLKNVNMTIHRGEKIAIVGYNGAGKTTLVKLLMHLYQPDSGAILYNGTDIREYETDSYRSHIAAVFQDYRIFAATIAENVLGDEYTEADRDRVEKALCMATFDDKLSSLPDGINTMLTREFDNSGTNLSGGETQKIAIARVFARPCEMIIMDEPSSALDPMAEYELNRHILQFASDKTVVFISHRLSTTRNVDRIYMFEDGRVIESGNHDELMALGGKYAEMFTIQAEKYRR